jgi:hypothetical protein
MFRFLTVSSHIEPETVKPGKYKIGFPLPIISTVKGNDSIVFDLLVVFIEEEQLIVFNKRTK